MNQIHGHEDCLFGGVKLTKIADPDKYLYSGYGIGFISHLLFALPNFDWGKSVVFGVYMSSSENIDNKKRHLNS